MSHYIIDRRDIEFVLFEQLGLQRLSETERFEDYSRELCDMVLSGAVDMATKVLAPTNQPADRAGCTFSKGKVTVPEVYQKAYKLFCEGGWSGPTHPIELGGQGMPATLYAAIAEMFVGSCPGFYFYPGLASAAGHLIESFGTPKLVKLFVEKMYTGAWGGTMCLTEPGAGSAVGDLVTAAKDNGDGTYNITGTKIFITGGEQDLTDNIIHLVLARLEGAPSGIKGVSLFAVPKVWVHEDGSLGDLNDVECAGIEHKMGLNGCSTCVMNFGDNGGSRGFLIGKENQGIIAMFQMMNEARILCGLQGSAAANASYQSALKYAKERIQGTSIKDFKNPNAPRVAIIEHPDVRRMLATMKAYGEGTRALLLKTSFYADLITTTTDKAEQTKYQMLIDLLTPICKAYATDKGFKVTELGIQTYGGYGYISEYPAEQYMRDVKIASLYEGTNGIQAMDLLGRKMTINNGALFLTWLQEINEFIEKEGKREALSTQIKSLDGAKNALAGVAFLFGSIGRKDPEYSMLCATPFLEMFGDVVVSHILLEQACIALDKLEAGSTEKSFYNNKVKTACFFAASILPRTRMNAALIKSQDRSALDMDF